MKVSVILAHPDRKSFNHALFKTVCRTLKSQGHTVFLHDLYKERFDPILSSREISRKARVDKSVKKYCRELTQSNGIVIIHPNWWGQPPAILKGWIDRVLRPGIAYEFENGDSGEGVPVGLLKAKIAVIFTSSNTKLEREQAVFGDPLETLWKNCIFGLCGVKNVVRKNFSVIVTSSDAERKAWLTEAEALTRDLFPENKRLIKRVDKYFVYIVECQDGTFYTGYTHDLAQRLKLHNCGRGAKYLRGRRPVKLVYAKEYAYYKIALKEERRIKTLSKEEKRKLVANGNGRIESATVVCPG